jgi:hypothetical protein
MRNTARWAATLGLTATAICGPLTGSALAAQDATPAMTTPVRAVTLSCAPTASGTHPDAMSACVELRGVGGDFDALRARDGVLCTKQYDPVIVTVDGVWQGKRVSYERTFANECVKGSFGTSLFAF